MERRRPPRTPNVTPASRSLEDESLAGDLVYAVVDEKRAAEIVDASGSAVMTALMKGATLSTFEFANADGTRAGKLKVNSVAVPHDQPPHVASGSVVAQGPPMGIPLIAKSASVPSAPQKPTSRTRVIARTFHAPAPHLC